MVSWMDQSLSCFGAYAYAVPSARDFFVLFLNWLYLRQPVITSKLQTFFLCLLLPQFGFLWPIGSVPL